MVEFDTPGDLFKVVHRFCSVLTWKMFKVIRDLGAQAFPNCSPRVTKTTISQNSLVLWIRVEISYFHS